jgi:RNA polymerase sigma-32 factor
MADKTKKAVVLPKIEDEEEFSDGIDSEEDLLADVEIEQDENSAEIDDDLDNEDIEVEILSPGSSSTALIPRQSSSSVVRFDPLQRYMNELRAYPVLPAEEQRELAVRYKEQGDLEAAHTLVTSNLRLVVKIAMDYHKYWMNLLDLVQEGNVGLMQAVKHYDPYKGVKLSSYSSFWIKAYILKFIIDNWSLVKIGTTQAQRKLFFNLKKEKEKYALLGYEATPENIASDLNVKPEVVVEMEQRMAGGDLSLDAPVGNDSDDRHIDFLESRQREIDDHLADQELQQLFRTKLVEFRQEIEDKEAYIFDNRLLSENPQTLNDIGNHYGVSRERIRQIEERLIKKLREFVQKEVPELADISVVSPQR